jgi:lipopolysaccharide export system protein LptC
MTRTDADYQTLDALAISAKSGSVGRGYTRFVKTLRVVLPLTALGLITLVMAWPDVERHTAPPPKESIVPDAKMGQNELINPRYESTDKDLQPYTITAARATQNPDNPELVTLEKPEADMKMSDGAWMAGRSETALYEQNAEKLLLKGDVNIFHDSGYTLKTPELRVNLKTSEAFSDQDVHIQGPAGTLAATGMDANQISEKIIFKGPATLVLYDAGNGFSVDRGKP